MHVPEPVPNCLINIAVGSLLGYRPTIVFMCLVQAPFFFKSDLISASFSSYPSLCLRDGCPNVVAAEE